MSAAQQALEAARAAGVRAGLARAAAVVRQSTVMFDAVQRSHRVTAALRVFAEREQELFAKEIEAEAARLEAEAARA